MARSRSFVLALCCLGVAGTSVVACGGDGDSGAGGSGGGTVPNDPSVATTTTLSPLERPVVDGCGNDLSDLSSTVWGVDPGSGEVRWQTSLPLAEAYLLRDDSGNPRISFVLRPVEAVLDADSGEVLATPDAGVHEVLVDVSGATTSGVAGLLVDGEPQPVTFVVDGVSVSTARGETGQTSVALTGADPATGAPVWTVDLGPADAVAALSPPVVYGDTVVVLASPPEPTCS